MRFRRQGLRRRIRGMTLLEIMISCGLLAVVFAATAFIQSISAKQIQSLYGDARTLHRAHLVLERIRYKLMMGRVGTAVVQDSGRTLRYTNPNAGPGVVSGFRLLDGKVYYYENMATEDPSAPGQGIGPVENIQFAILGAGNAVRITTTTVQRHAWKLLPRPYNLSAEIALRN